MVRKFLFILFTLGLIVHLTSCSTSTEDVGENATTIRANPTSLYDATARTSAAPVEIQKNTAMISGIVATKYAEGTKVAASMIAIPTGTPIPQTMTIPPSSDLCKRTDLKSEVIQGSPATGGLFLFYMVLTNISDHPCYVWAWPDIHFLDRQHQPLQVQYSYYDPNEGDQSAVATKRVMEVSSLKVGLYPRSSVNINMGWRNWCGSKLDEGIIIRLTLIDDQEMIDVETDVKAFCDYPGNPSVVSVSRLVEGINAAPTWETGAFWR